MAPLINPSQCLLDLDTHPEPVPEEDSQSKPALDDLGLFESQVSGSTGRTWPFKSVGVLTLYHVND